MSKTAAAKPDEGDVVVRKRVIQILLLDLRSRDGDHATPTALIGLFLGYSISSRVVLLLHRPYSYSQEETY
jgi:hypothetical protein